MEGAGLALIQEIDASSWSFTSRPGHLGCADYLRPTDKETYQSTLQNEPIVLGCGADAISCLSAQAQAVGHI
jgi:hypothetical protein